MKDIDLQEEKMETVTIIKVLNNNVVMANHPEDGEVIIISNGIGFNRKRNEQLTISETDKVFVLKDEKEQEQYKKLIPKMDEDLQRVIIEAIEHIDEHVSGPLNEHIHIGLTDHLLFSLERVRKGFTIHNPFLIETVTLYPFEQKLAKEVVELIGERTGIYLPEDEVGFITLHIHSALMNKDLGEVNKHSQLVTHLIQVIEKELQITLDKESLGYMRLVRHLRFAIERVVRGEKIEESNKLENLLKNDII